MAIFHFNAQIIGKSKGKSAVAAAAYRSAVSLQSECQGILFDYSRKRGVAFSEIMLPENAPEWMSDRQLLWNGVEKFEKRKDATLAREIEVALPVEFSLEQNKALLRDYLKANFVDLGMVADYSIHDLDSHNPHVHIMFTLRSVQGDSFGKKVREWNDKSLFESWREQWALTSNRHLALNGFDQRIDHRSYEEQGIALEPTLHRGCVVEHSREPENLDRYQKAQEIQKRNLERLLKDPSIAVDLLTQHDSIFSHQDLSKFVHYRTGGLEEFNQLKFAIEACKDLVNLGIGLDGKYYYASQKALERERALLDCSLRLSKSSQHTVKAERFQCVAQNFTLTEEQKEAFDFILSGQDLSLVVGFAGTGKGYLMDAVREAYEAEGYRVVGTALAGKAADGLAQSAHINSKTIARFLLDWENDRDMLNNKTVLIVDEAGMIGTRQLQMLLAEAETAGAKIILCGDPEQIPSIEAGSPFRFLLERLSHKFLKTIIRQKIDWQKEATLQLSTQQHGQALDQYKAQRHIHAQETRALALESLVKAWFSYNQANPNKEAIMMTYRNKDVLAMNQLAREYLKQDKKLSNEIIIDQAERGEIRLAQGERILFLRNESSLTVKNGQLGTITHLQGTVMRIQMDRGDILAFDARDYHDFTYGYAATIHKLQGVTVDQSFVLATPHFDRFITNVALDRHRYGVEVYYGEDDFKSHENFRRSLSRGESKVLAVEFAQARGLDYALEQDQGALIESQLDFSSYYQKILNEAQPIANTIAESFLKNEFSLGNISVKSLQFHPAVWERETQSYMPALIVKAVGYQKDLGLESKGVQVHFIDPETARKPELTYPVRYSGSPDAIVMLQKPAEKDNRWFVAVDLETGLAISKADPAIRVAAIASNEKLERVPLLSRGGNEELILCANQSSDIELLEKAINLFEQKGFKVKLAKPDQEASFVELLKTEGKEAVCEQVKLAKEYVSEKLSKEIETMVKTFSELDKNMQEAEQQPYAGSRMLAREAIEHYAEEVAKNEKLLRVVKKQEPELYKRIDLILEQDRGVEIEID